MSAATGEPVRFREVLAQVGRSDFHGTYHDSEYGRSAAKEAERERVLEYILSHGYERIRFLSMPGADWAFEHMLLDALPASQLVGLERSFSVYARARRAMPCGGKAKGAPPNLRHLQDRVLQYGAGNVVYSRVRANVSASGLGPRSVRSNRLLLMASDVYASMMATDYGATMDQRKEFFEKFYRRDAAWLDFTSTLCPTVEETLRHLPLCMHPNDGGNPVVVTLRNGRDGCRGADARVDRITQIQPAFSVRDYWTYAGKNGSSMLTVCGVLA